MARQEIECAVCEDPAGGMENFMRTVDANIKRHGRHLTGVVDTRPFMYTTGHAERHGLPELIILGLAYPSAGRLLNAIGDMMFTAADEGAAWTFPRDVDLGGAFPARLQAVRNPAHVKDEFTCTCGRRLGHRDYRVVQVILCDKEGRFPGHPECAEPFASQVIL